MTTESTPQALLKRAADVIDKRGWHQGGYTNDTGCVCTLGALRVAAAGVPDDAPYWDVQSAALDLPGRFDDPDHDEVDRAAVALEDYFGRHNILGWDVADWNDNPERTKDEVTAALRAAAEEVESK